MAAHSKIGASSYKRWKACPGSVRLSEGVPKKSSSYAEEGTLAHEVAEYRLTHLSWPTYATDEQIEAVQVYVDEIESHKERHKVRMLEHKFDMSDLHPQLFGTADCVIYDPKARKLMVYDYKHGAGVPVEVEANEQLMYYGLGALRSLNLSVKEVELIVVQPRCFHKDGPIRRWSCDPLTLLEFEVDLVEAAKRTEDPNAPIIPEDPVKGEDHCRFCPASAICPGKHERALELAREEFKPALSYSPEKLSEVLHWLPALKAWAKSVEDFAERVVDQGGSIPGWKLVAKRGTRRWRDPAEAEKVLRTGGFCLSDKDMYIREFKSPAQIEKALGKGGKAKIEPLIITESSGTRLAPESDPAPAVTNDPSKDFKVIEESNDPWG